LKLVQKIAGYTLKTIGIGKDFCRTEAAQQLIEKIDKWDYMKLKSFCTTKEMISKLKRPHTELKNIFTSLYIRQGTYDQNINGAQKIKLPQTQ
jgi:hypothetical protein